MLMLLTAYFLVVRASYPLKSMKWSIDWSLLKDTQLDSGPGSTEAGLPYILFERITTRDWNSPLSL